MKKILKSSGFSVGVDIEDISRFEKMARNRKEAELAKIYTKNEIVYCFSKAKPAQHLAARFSGKEAVIKALTGLGFKTFYSEVEILNTGDKVPTVTLLNSKAKGKIHISISLAHDKTKSIAFVVASIKTCLSVL
jgi:holo-[acyl-carrier protein] synthase